MRAAAELGITTVAVYSEDDAQALHVRRAGAGPPPCAASGPAPTSTSSDRRRRRRAATATPSIPATASSASRQSSPAAAEAAGILRRARAPRRSTIFGDKTAARDLAAALRRARSCGAPAGPDARRAPTSSFLASLGAGAAMVIKAVAGGGGRGMRVVSRADDVAEAYARCRSEAHAGLRQRRRLRRGVPARAPATSRSRSPATARGAVTHLWERECSIQRRHQKLVEIAPGARRSTPALRTRILADAVRMAARPSYDNLGTFEFLVDADAGAEPPTPSSRPTPASRWSTP